VTSGNGILTTKQRNFKLITQAIFTEPKPQKLMVPDKDSNFLAHVCFQLVSFRHWNDISIGLIFINAMVLAAPYYGMPSGYAGTLHTVNHVISFLFLFELIARTFAYSPSQFFQSGWNRFDCGVVATMTTASILSIALNTDGLAAVGAARLLLLARQGHRHAHSLRTIIVTLASSIAPIGSVLSMISLIFFIYAVIGMTFFGNVRHGNSITSHYNFEKFDQAMLTLLMMITGENWTGIMHDCAIEFPRCTSYETVLQDGTVLAPDCGDSTAAYLFFISFYFIGTFFLLSLFVAVISDCFQTCNAMRSFGIEKDVFEHFGQLWLESTDKNDPPFKFLHTYQLRGFMLQLGPPLGGDSLQKLKDVHDQVTYMLGEPRTLPDGRTTVGVGYRKLLWLLVMESGSLDQIPFSERTIRVDELKRLKALAMMRRFSAMWRGNRVKAAFEAHKREAFQSSGDPSNLDTFWLSIHGQGKLEATTRAADVELSDINYDEEGANNDASYEAKPLNEITFNPNILQPHQATQRVQFSDGGGGSDDGSADARVSINELREDGNPTADEELLQELSEEFPEELAEELPEELPEELGFHPINFLDDEQSQAEKSDIADEAVEISDEGSEELPGSPLSLRQRALSRARKANAQIIPTDDFNDADDASVDKNPSPASQPCLSPASSRMRVLATLRKKKLSHV